jgi:FOG: Ankyrin repeat
MVRYQLKKEICLFIQKGYKMNSFCKIVFSITLLTVLYSAPVLCMDIFDAVFAGNTARVRELLDPVSVPAETRLALVNQKDNHGWTPLHCAARNGHADIVRMLLNAVPEDARLALVNQQNNNGETLLFYAAFSGQAEIARMLLDAVPEVARLTLVNQKDNYGWTPLHCAAYNGKIEIAQMLTADGACLDDQNNQGKTPAQVAREKGHPEVANLIENAQQRIANARQQTQNMALAMAQAFHPRLGPYSPVPFMSQDLLREVMTLVGQANEQAARQPEPEQAPRGCVVS